MPVYLFSRCSFTISPLHNFRYFIPSALLPYPAPPSYPVADVKALRCIPTAHHDGDTEFTRNDGGGSLPAKCRS